MVIQNYVLGFAFNKEKTKVLLIQKNRPEWQAGLFNGIGGKIEISDTFPIFGMIREFREETGINTFPEDWNQYAVLSSSNFHVSCFWSILENIDDYQSTTDEIVHLVDVQDLFNVQYKNCLDNLIWLIPMALEKNIRQISSYNTYSF